MNRSLPAVALLIGAALLAGRADADCADGTLQQAKQAFERAKSFEAQGQKGHALHAYHAATGSVCEGTNPYEPEAARRAAPLGAELGAAAEKRGQFERAFDLYEAGGQFIAADRALMQIVRANPDSVGAWGRANSHFRYRQGAFSANSAGVLKVTGPYSLDTSYLPELAAMPAKAIERAIQKEATSFNEQYLEDMVRREQSRADDATDASAVQRTISTEQAFAQKWQQKDPLKDSRAAISNMLSWAFNNTNDEKFVAQTTAKAHQLAEQRGTTLSRKYSGSPELLEAAQSYFGMLGSDNPKTAGLVASVRAQALKLGDEANAKQRWTLAAAYYEAAGERDKAAAVRAKRDQLAMQKMQPAIDQARKQAEDLQREYSDPARIEEMKKQAAAAQKALQEQQAGSKANKAKNRQSAEELEKELGL